MPETVSVALPFAPIYPAGGLAWSEHEQIAVALEHLVLVVDATRPHAPALELEPAERVEKGDPEEEPKRSSIRHARLHSAGSAVSTHVRALCWSPPGVAADGGCALLAVTQSGRAELALLPALAWVEQLETVAEPSRLIEPAPAGGKAQGGKRAVRTRTDAEFVLCCAWDRHLYHAPPATPGLSPNPPGPSPGAAPHTLLALGSKPPGLLRLTAAAAVAVARAPAVASVRAEVGAEAEELAAALVAEVAPPRVGARGSLRVTTMVAVAVVIVVVAATARVEGDVAEERGWGWASALAWAPAEESGEGELFL
ncbi:hypothetical protein T492DRAFT_900987 [Pavlovales sp. CCMP2436]|nr:hypothetical protein T492DRAFT_900987 [Pavlovales sp. CCMP2436]